MYLDVDERRRFAQSQHEYLCEQLQFTGDETVTIANGRRSQNVRLSFNHPVKYLAWMIKGSVHGQYTGGPLGTYAESFSPLFSAKLQLNGHDRMNERMGSYYNQVQPYSTVGSRPIAGLNLFSFSLRPQEHQPSGTCNFSRIDNATLQLSFKAAATGATTVADVQDESTTVAAATKLNALKVYAVNYNVLRIASGINLLCLTVDCVLSSMAILRVINSVMPWLVYNRLVLHASHAVRQTQIAGNS